MKVIQLHFNKMGRNRSRRYKCEITEHIEQLLKANNRPIVDIAIEAVGTEPIMRISYNGKSIGDIMMDKNHISSMDKNIIKTSVYVDTLMVSNIKDSIIKNIIIYLKNLENSVMIRA